MFVDFFEKYQMSTASRIITESTTSFSLEGMVAPRIHNEGDVSLWVLGMEVKPNQQFNLLANGFVEGTGSIAIEFQEPKTSNERKRAVVIYNGITEKQCR